MGTKSGRATARWRRPSGLNLAAGARSPRGSRPTDWRQSAIAIASVVSALLVAAGLWYNRQANHETAEANRNQQQVAERGQVAERFSKATEQLGQEGADKLNIRLGGIYALQRLMRDSPDDEPVIVDVLSAFVRTHATPLPQSTPVPGAPLAPSPLDVQAAVTVLAGRPNATSVDLRGVVLSMPETDLRHGNLHGVTLAQANLTHTNLYSADLRGADLRGATLITANLNSATLRGADLRGANLRGALLYQANLDSADLKGASLQGAFVGDANLRGASLAGANLHGADLNDVILDDANLANADLTNVDLSGATLRGAYLRGAKLTGVRNADFSGAQFQ